MPHISKIEIFFTKTTKITKITIKTKIMIYIWIIIVLLALCVFIRTNYNRFDNIETIKKNFYNILHNYTSIDMSVMIGRRVDNDDRISDNDNYNISGGSVPALIIPKEYSISPIVLLKVAVFPRFDTRYNAYLNKIVLLKNPNT